MIRALFFILSVSSFCHFSFAQNIRLEGTWLLEEVQIDNQQEKALEINKENCFFSHYVDPANRLEFTSNTILIIQGEERYTYEWHIENGVLILAASNTVWVQGSNDEIEIQESEGESSFEVQRKGKSLILTRYNNTFTESYTFKVAK